MARMDLSEDFSSDFFSQNFERTEKFMNSSSCVDEVRGIVTYDRFERLLWLMFRLNPNVVQISRSSESMPQSERAGIDIIRSLHKMIADGYSIAINHAEELDPDLAMVSREMAGFFGGSAHIALFLTPPECKSFLPHSDAVDVIAMQFEGNKAWSIAGECGLDTKPHTVTCAEPTYRSRYDLAPGDLLYVPRGLTHSVVGSGQALSLHASVALNPIRRTDVVAEAFAAHEQITPDLRKTALHHLHPGEHRHAINKFDTVSKFEFSRRELSTAVTRVAADRIAKLTQPPGRLRDIAQNRAFNPTSYFARRAGMPAEVVFDAKSSLATIAFPGLVREKMSPRDSALQFPGVFISALEFVRDARQPFRCDDLPGPFPAKLKAGLIERLWSDGLLYACQLPPE